MLLQSSLTFISIPRSFSIDKLHFEGNTSIIGSGNYTIDADLGKVYSTGTGSADGKNWNITYTYTYWDSDGCSGVNTTVTALKKIPTWLGIIVILAIVGILLAIVFNVLPGQGFAGIGGIGMGGGAGSAGEVAEV